MGMRKSPQKSPAAHVSPASDYRKRRLKISTPTAIVLTTITVLMLTVIAEPVGWSALAWVALLPWTIAMAGMEKTARCLLLSYIAGFIYFLTSLYWLMGVTVPGWIGLCFYLAWYFPLCGFILRRLYLKYRWPFTIILPIVWVGQEYLRATVMTGFGWLFLAHSQHEHLALIQMCDIFGAYGLTFLIAMVNGLFIDLLLRPLKQKSSDAGRLFFGATSLILLTIAAVVCSWLYGMYRLNQGQETITAGPTAAVIQGAIPQYVKESGESDGDIFNQHLDLTNQAIAAAAVPALVVWPETMTGAPINDEYIGLRIPGIDLSSSQLLQQSRAFHEQLRQVAQKNVAILVGTPALEYDTIRREISRNSNSALLYLPDGRRFAKRYDKMHLVPFGEVVPFEQSWPWLYNMLNRLTPYDYDYTLDAGTEPVVFEFPAAGADRPWRFAVAICYEDVMAQVPRQLAQDKRVDFLLNISNDGWFVTGGRDGKSIQPTSELTQHLAICRFRAVENRVGIARAVNCGISAFIKPDGTVQRTPLAGTLDANPRNRQATAGFLTDNIYIDSRVSLYNHIGDIFAIVCTVSMVFLLIAALWKTGKHGR